MRPWLLITALTCTACGPNEFEEAAQKESGSHLECEEKARCAGMVYVDCQASTDGPAYYFDEDTVEVIARCGGYCFLPEHLEMCRATCPPPAWTCSP